VPGVERIQNLSHGSAPSNDLLFLVVGGEPRPGFARRSNPNEFIVLHEMAFNRVDVSDNK